MLAPDPWHDVQPDPWNDVRSVQAHPIISLGQAIALQLVQLDTRLGSSRHNPSTLWLALMLDAAFGAGGQFFFTSRHQM